MAETRWLKWRQLEGEGLMRHTCSQGWMTLPTLPHRCGLLESSSVGTLLPVPQGTL